MPGSSLAQAQAALNEHDLAFVPLPLLSPVLANLLALRGRDQLRVLLGQRRLGHLQNALYAANHQSTSSTM